MYGEAQARLVEAVPPVLARVRAAPADATTSEMLVEFEVLGTTGTLHYALSEAEAAAKGGQVIREQHVVRSGLFDSFSSSKTNQVRTCIVAVFAWVEQRIK